jgi:hypothetical protein
VTTVRGRTAFGEAYDLCGIAIGSLVKTMKKPFIGKTWKECSPLSSLCTLPLGLPSRLRQRPDTVSPGLVFRQDLLRVGKVLLWLP